MSGCLGVYKPDVNNHLENTYFIHSSSLSLGHLIFHLWDLDDSLVLLTAVPAPSPNLCLLTCHITSGPLADKPPRSLWWPYWLYVLSNLFGSTAKGESCTPLPQQQRYTHSSGFSLKKSISSPPKGLQHLICSNPLRIETQNWSDFLGIPSWLDTESLVIFLYMCPPTDYNSFVQPSGNLAHTHQTLLFSPSCFTHVTKTGPQSNIYWPFIIY